MNRYRPPQRTPDAIRPLRPGSVAAQTVLRVWQGCSLFTIGWEDIARDPELPFVLLTQLAGRGRAEVRVTGSPIVARTALREANERVPRARPSTNGTAPRPVILTVTKIPRWPSEWYLLGVQGDRRTDVPVPLDLLLAGQPAADDGAAA